MIRRGAAAVAMALAVTRSAAAQYRTIDAVTWADAASGAWSSLTAACDTTRAGVGGGAPTTLPGLPPIPGAVNDSPAYFLAGAMGAGAVKNDAALRGGRGAAFVQVRAHWAPMNRCRTDAFATIAAATPGSATVLIEGRIRLIPGNTFAPTAEGAIAQSMGDAGDAETRSTRMAIRLSAALPNPYTWTLQPIIRLFMGEKTPRLDIKARFHGGWAAFAGDYWRPLPPNPPPNPNGTPAVLRVSWGGGGSFTDAGGTAMVTVLHLPVSIVAASEHIIGGYQPVGHARATDALGLAWRLPGHDKNLWLVARAERLRDLETRTTYRVELAHLLLGSR